jgi:hypothetical protein
MATQTTTPTSPTIARPADCPLCEERRAQAAQDPIVDIDRWLEHFRRNAQNRPEPAWDAPITLSPEVIRPLLRSLEQFELGDGGGPDRLIAFDAHRFSGATNARQELVDLWFIEEKEHSRLLGDAVKRFGGRKISAHWSFSAFCLSRRMFGVVFELYVLLVTEIVSTAYYRLLNRHTEDEAVRGVCRLILRDEAGHVAFHRDRMSRMPWAHYGKWWGVFFRWLALGAATMLWVNHAPALCAVGGTRKEFYGEVGIEVEQFIARLRRDMALFRANDCVKGKCV